MADLAELLERVKAATGPDRELDGDIAEAFGPHWNGRDLTRGQAPAVTRSIDAAMALVERMLPGWRVQLFERDPEDGGGWNARLKRRSPWDLVALDEVAPLPRTAPLALLAALLSALIAKPASGDVGSANLNQKG